MQKVTRSFDQVAESFDSVIPPLPREYIHLIQTRFGLHETDRIVDLGCGSGLLTFPLAEFCSRVEGVDSSKEMIRLARERDTERRIKWIARPAEELEWEHESYSLFICFEAFHL